MRHLCALGSTGVQATENCGLRPALRDGVETERTRPLAARESKGFVDTQLRLRESSRGLGPEWPERLARIEQSAAPILLPADAQRVVPPARPSAAAARSRSTTARKPDQPKRGPQDPGSRQQPPQHRTDGPDTGRGRAR